MTEARHAVVFTATLVLTLCTGAAADDIRLDEVRAVNDQTIVLDVSYSFTSQHDNDVVLVVRPAPRTLMHELEIAPMFRGVVHTDTYRHVSFRVTHTGDEELGIRGFVAGFSEVADGLQRPFYTSVLEVTWSFPVREGGGKAVLYYDPVGSGINPLQLARFRRLTAALEEQGLDPEDVIRDRRVQRFLRLHAAVDQESAAEADLEIAENTSDYEPPTAGASGVIEAGEQETEHPEAGGPQRISKLVIDSIEAHERGCYVVNFSYGINNVVGITPLTFDVEFKGSANQWITQHPYRHQAPEENWEGSGCISVWIDSPDAPLSLGNADIRLRARGSDGATWARVAMKTGFAWYKSYDSITYHSLVNHCASPEAVPRPAVGLNEGEWSLAEYFHGRYDEEPAMLVFRTARGVYAAGMFMPHRGGQGLEGVWIIDLTCYDPSVGVGDVGFRDGHVPASDADRGISRPSYDNGGLLTEGEPFDLDRDGLNCEAGEGDIVVETDGTGKYFLRAINGCEMYY